MKIVAIMQHKFYNIYNNQWEVDREEEITFTYENHVLGLIGSAWKKSIEPDDVADAIKNYFTGTNYTLADFYAIE